MPMTSLICATLLAAPQGGLVYRNRELDLEFTYPAAWKVRRERLFEVLEFLIEGKEGKVQVFGTDFRFPAGHWQDVTRQINEQSGRVVQRQWEEEFLGVPLLLTQVAERKGNETQMLLIGLVYADKPQKLNFRLTAPAPIFDQAVQQWRDVLMTARTISGRLPGAENPDRPASAQPQATRPDPRREVPPVVLAPTTGPAKLEVAPNRLVADAARGLFAYAPAGWSLEEGQLKLQGLQGKAQFRAATLDAAGSRSAYLRRQGELLGELSRVTRREESRPAPNRAGFTVNVMNRIGLNAQNQDTVQVLAAGWANGLSWMVDYAGTPAQFSADQAALRELFNRLSVAPQ